MGRTLARADIPSLGKVVKEFYSEDLKEPPGQAIVTVKIGHQLYLKKNTMTRPLLTGAAQK